MKKHPLIFLLFSLLLVGCHKGLNLDSTVKVSGDDYNYTGKNVLASDLPTLKSEDERKPFKSVAVHHGFQQLDNHQYAEVRTIDFGENWAYLKNDSDINGEIYFEDTYLLYEDNYTFIVHPDQSDPHNFDSYLYDANRNFYDEYITNYTNYYWAMQFYDLAKRFTNAESLKNYTEFGSPVTVSFTKKDNFYQIVRHTIFGSGKSQEDRYYGDRLEIIDGHITKYESYRVTYLDKKHYDNSYWKNNYTYGASTDAYPGPRPNRIPLDKGLERKVIYGAGLPDVEHKNNWPEVTQAVMHIFNSQGNPDYTTDSVLNFYENGFTRHDITTLPWSNEPDYTLGVYYEGDNTFFVGRGNNSFDEKHPDSDKAKYNELERELLGNYGYFVKNLPNLIDSLAHYRDDSNQTFVYDYRREYVTLFEAGDYYCFDVNKGDNNFEEYWFKIDDGLPTFFEHAYKKNNPETTSFIDITVEQRETITLTYGAAKPAYAGPRYSGE